MNMKFNLAIILAGIAATASINNAFAVQETTPQNMTCQEFIDMNPKFMTPIAFWVVNKNVDFKGGDYVHWNEVETVSVPRIIKQCHETPRATLGELAQKGK